MPPAVRVDVDSSQDAETPQGTLPIAFDGLWITGAGPEEILALHCGERGFHFRVEREFNRLSVLLSAHDDVSIRDLGAMKLYHVPDAKPSPPEDRDEDVNPF